MSVDFRFVDYNYALQSNVAITATSENVNFPAINAGKEFRSKTWRSNGFFVIDSTNDKIDFNEGGPELNGTITQGEYSADDLETAIKAALESVGGDTYTVTFGTNNGIWTIASSGSTFELLFSSGTNSASSVHSSIGFSDVDLTGSLSYDGASIALHTVERVIVDFKTTEEIDTFALLYDPRIGINLSEEATVHLKANHSSEWTSPAIDITLTLDQDFSVYTHFFTSDQAYRFWCVEIVDPRNPALYVDVGTIVLGKSTTFARIPDNGYQYRKIDNSRLQKTDYQNVYIDSFSPNRELSFNFGILEYSQVQVMEQIYDRVGLRSPVFVALDVQESLYDKDNIAIYGRMSKTLDFTHIVTKHFKSKFKITENF